MAVFLNVISKNNTLAKGANPARRALIFPAANRKKTAGKLDT